MEAAEKTIKIFAVDDDKKHLLVLEDSLTKNLPYQIEVENYESGEAVLNALSKDPDIVILDYYFDSEDKNSATGIEVLKRIKSKRPELPVVMMSHQDNIEVAVQCYDYGAKDYVVKNETAYARAQIIVRNVIHEILKEQQIQKYKASVKTAYYVLGIFIVFLLAVIVYLAFELSNI
ncbi:MAG: response regulator [Chitinophagales bacterium]